MKGLLASLDRAPLYWVAVGLGLLVFGLNQQGFSLQELPGLTEQGRLDQAFIEVLRSGDRVYEVVPDSPQTFGSHLLSQLLVAVTSLVTGDTHRAGIWLSFAGAVGTLTGLYVLAIRIYPLRGFALSATLGAGALGTLHLAISPNPSAALGMALVVWGMVFFLTALTETQPHDVFFSGLLFGLAGYIRIELSLIWVFLAIYLILLQLFHGKARTHEPSAISMALGGLITVLLVLWPMMHRNMTLAGTPVLPGYDAELILGAPALAGEHIVTGFAERLGHGLHLLTFSAQGPGIFVGLLWPIGMAVCLFMGRHKAIPFFWIPVLLGTLLGMTGLSMVTGAESYSQTLLILSPMLFPFALLPLAFVVEQILQHSPQSTANCRWIWTGVALGFFLLVQLPTWLHSGSKNSEPAADVAWIEDFSGLPISQRTGILVSDQPGPLVSRGKREVIGTRGQTDWSILSTSTAHGGFQTDKLLSYLKSRQVSALHLANPEDPLVDRLRLLEEAPEFQLVGSVRPPHRFFVISWP